MSNETKRGIEVKRGKDGFLHTTEIATNQDNLDWEHFILTAGLTDEGCEVVIDHTKPIVVYDIHEVRHHVLLNEKCQMTTIQLAETGEEVESILIDAENSFWFIAPGVPKQTVQ